MAGVLSSGASLAAAGDKGAVGERLDETVRRALAFALEGSA